MTTKIVSFTHAIDGRIIRPKPNRKSIANYQDKNKCPKTMNSLIR